ncbi:uncharacterized protein dati isoform X3 [Chironomus tepperi]|uniref:uncharacterized protein dati isoform X3 n=1 Tax=Chironomus tepperi TaxID=113505 RepID=UPI00391FA718
MSLDIQQQHFKMNSDFWPQARGPPVSTATNLNFPSMMDTTSADYLNNTGRNPQQQQQQPPQQQQAATGFLNNNNNNNNNENNNVDMKEHLMSQSTDQNLQNNFNSQASGFSMTQQQQQPNGQAQPQQQQQQPPPSASPGAENSSPEAKFNADKLVNEIQQQLSRSNNTPSINERTLEECWSTLQRIFMHKSAMQMQHARDIQRSGAGSTGTSESKPHQCQQCLKSFSSNHQLVQHIRVHTGEKPYKCTYCDRRFKQLSHVQQHTRLHTGERPYKCHLPDCGRAFIQLSNLQQHLRNHDAQVERAKNRPFHCNICGKGFATESSLRTHTSKELQLHLGVLQQHAALIGGPNATSCLICHKLFLGGEALMEHMKTHHKQETTPPAPAPSPPPMSDPMSPNDQYSLSKQQRRTANHPCPVCGKSYVNEGSLRKHLACHPETSQIANSLRMWPCSVCQAVFTHEAGLLTHMEHMRTDPKHQFAAQYMLSRAAAERRERDTILASAIAGGSGLLSQISQNSRGASPAHSEASSCNDRMNSPHPDSHGNENNQNNANSNNTNNNNPENASDNNNNTNGATNLSTSGNLNYNGKLSVNDVLRTPPGQHLHQQYQQIVSAAAANIVAQNQNSCNGLGSPVNPASSAAQAVANLAAVMRQNQPLVNGNHQSPSNYGHQNNSQMNQHSSHHHHHHQDSDAAMRIHQAEALLRSQAEAALRLAVSQAAAVVASSSNDSNTNNQFRHHNGMPYNNHHHQNNPSSQIQSQFSPDLSEALRLQEQRLEQALRLHNSELGLHQQHHQQP